ncbi:hypothetical protein MASR1M6_02720 [Rubrivivax sp.]
MLEERGVVDDGVDAAGRGDHLWHERVHRRLVGEVGLQQPGLCAERTHLRRDLLGLLGRAAVVQREVEAVRGEFERDRAPQAARRAGDERHRPRRDRRHAVGGGDAGHAYLE